MISRPETPSLIPLKGAIWLYFILLLTEGALRKWILPGYSDLLFIVRDPIVIIIYILALQARMFHLRPAIILLGLITFASALFSIFSDVPAAVILFGLRTNYLHVPLVFIMAAGLDRNDVVRFGRVVLVMTIPIFGLMLVQFDSSPDALINAGAGGNLNGQIRGALGKIRPPGPFSFIDGVVAYFSLSAAFVYYGWIKPGAIGRGLLLIATLITLMAVPISISRSLLLGVLIVVCFGLAVSLGNMRKAARFIVPLVLGGLLLLLASKPVYVQAFASRWNDAIDAGKGTFYENIVARSLDTYTGAIGLLDKAPLLGTGVGVGTLAGARMMTGKVAFTLSESELSRIVLELGPVLGVLFIGWRVWLALALIIGGWRSRATTHDELSWLIAGAVAFGVFAGQWGSSTQLGFAVFGAGLAMAARNAPAEETDMVPDEEEAEAMPIA